MPQPFLNCIKKGGRVRSKRVNKTQYIKICFLNGKSYPGETHIYKSLTQKRNKSK